MTEARDICGVTLFFIFGTAAGDWISSMAVSVPSLYLISSVLMLLLAASAALSLRLSEKNFWLNAGVFTLAGLLCSVSFTLHGDLAPFDGTFISQTISSQAEKFRALTASIPYESKDSNALVKALLSGDRSDVSGSVQAAFRDSGAAHILALSGMHLGLIYGILLKALAFMGNKPGACRIRSLIIIVLCAWYTAVTGAASSLVRAMLFITLNESARILNRKTQPMNVFFAALILQLAAAPDNLYSPGFQLSYLAMAGIYLLYPWMKSWFPGPEVGLTSEEKKKIDPRKKNPMKRIWDAAALTISCQVFTAPAVWFHFGTFPKYFIITNLLAVPLSNFIMLTSVAVLLLSAAGMCPGFLVCINELSINLLTETLEIISSLP